MTSPFFVRNAPAVRAATAGTSLFPSVVLAQMALESGFGKSTLAARYGNYFGHKASARWQGRTVTLATPHDGQKQSAFRVYASLADCLRAHVALLRQPLYRAAQLAATPYAQVAALAKTYAEDSAYQTKLAALISSQNLTQFDTAAPGPAPYLVLAALGAAAYHYRARLRVMAKQLLLTKRF